MTVRDGVRKAWCVAPLGLGVFLHGIPGRRCALPWAGMFWPLWGRNTGVRGIFSDVGHLFICRQSMTLAPVDNFLAKPSVARRSRFSSVLPVPIS